MMPVSQANRVNVRHHGLDDCGVCALATALVIPWGQAKDAIFDDGLPHKKYATSTRDLIRGAHLLGYASIFGKAKGVRIGKTWTDIPLSAGQVAITAVHYENTRMGHWVVWDGLCVWDSNFDGPRRADAYDYIPLRFIVLEEDI
jgi:hypothetical protein